MAHRPGRVSAFRRSPAPWLILISIAALGMFASSPISAGADEPAHQATAWYVWSNVGSPWVLLNPTGRSQTAALVPASLTVNPPPFPCYANHPDVDATCARALEDQTGLTISNSITNYPPPYYVAVGFGQALASMIGNQFAPIGGRIASALLNLGVLWTLAFSLRRRHPDVGRYLALLATPTMIFYLVMVNPSGWEMTTALVLAAALASVLDGAEGGLRSSRIDRRSVLILGLASVALSLARPIGAVWAAGLTLGALSLATARTARETAKLVLIAVAPGIILGAAWYLTHGTAAGGPSGSSGPLEVSIGNLASWFALSISRSHDRLMEAVGWLGWDVFIPSALGEVFFLGWVLLLAALAQARPVSWAAAIIGIGGVVVFSSLVETSNWMNWPNWWQGRYELPFLIGFLFLLLLRSGDRAPRAVGAMTGVSLLTLGTMVWLNTMRYAFGLGDGHFLPLRLDDPAIDGAAFAVSLLVAGILVVVGVAQLGLATRWRAGPRVTAIA